jgi:hypothetical protein
MSNPNKEQKSLVQKLIQGFEEVIEHEAIGLGEDWDKRVAIDAVWALTHVLGKQASISKDKKIAKEAVMHWVLAEAVRGMQQHENLKVDMELFVSVKGPKGEPIKG